MQQPRASEGRLRPRASRLRAEVPSWLMSALLHLVLLLVLGLTFRLAPRPGVTAERRAEVGMPPKRQDGDRDESQTGADAGGGSGGGRGCEGRGGCPRGAADAPVPSGGRAKPPCSASPPRAGSSPTSSI